MTEIPFGVYSKVFAWLFPFVGNNLVLPVVGL
jgi:hypothetical protein